MGGYGSGQWYRWNSKPTEDNFHILSISRLVEQGAVKNNIHRTGKWQWLIDNAPVSNIDYEVNTRDGNRFFRAVYCTVETDKHYDFKIPLCTTNPHYGGVRWWFNCPNCSKRVGKLYNSGIYACRTCVGMAYESQRLDEAYRKLYKAHAIYRELKGISGLYGIDPLKPKGMHWKTYQKKLNQMRQLDTESEHLRVMECAGKLGML
jgi:ribosomal protein L37AE/L43A